jgi:hypothetical protein
VEKAGVEKAGAEKAGAEKSGLKLHPGEKGFDLGSLGGLVLNEDQRIEINLTDWLSHKPDCLAGRATAVLDSSNAEDATQELACKISFPEIAREEK